jgi:hypothetical protein
MKLMLVAVSALALGLAACGGTPSMPEAPEMPSVEAPSMETPAAPEAPATEAPAAPEAPATDAPEAPAP